ncbi:MAG: Crp/Fnr family transcriptional regulator [Dehalococcoidia bacterium]
MTRFLGSFRRPAASTARRAPSPAVEEKLRLLLAADLFQDLPEADVQRIEQMTVMSRCERGQIVYAPDEAREALFLLKRGRIEVYRLVEDGKKLVLNTVHPGMAFGDMALTGQRMLGGYAEAVEDCTICVMSRSDLEALIVEFPAVGVRLVRMLSERLADLEQRLEESSLRDVPSRVAAALVRAAEQGGPKVAMTHQQLADLVGTHRETITRTLGDLRDRRLIALGRSQIEVLDLDALRALAG